MERVILSPFPHSLSISASKFVTFCRKMFYLHFLFISSFSLHFIFISSFSLHFLAAWLQGCSGLWHPAPRIVLKLKVKFLLWRSNLRHLSKLCAVLSLQLDDPLWVAGRSLVGPCSCISSFYTPQICAKILIPPISIPLLSSSSGRRRSKLKV